MFVCWPTHRAPHQDDHAHPFISAPPHADDAARLKPAQDHPVQPLSCRLPAPARLVPSLRLPTSHAFATRAQPTYLLASPRFRPDRTAPRRLATPYPCQPCRLPVAAQLCPSPLHPRRLPSAQQDASHHDDGPTRTGPQRHSSRRLPWTTRHFPAPTDHPILPRPCIPSHADSPAQARSPQPRPLQPVPTTPDSPRLLLSVLSPLTFLRSPPPPSPCRLSLPNRSLTDRPLPCRLPAALRVRTPHHTPALRLPTNHPSAPRLTAYRLPCTARRWPAQPQPTSRFASLPA